MAPHLLPERMREPGVIDVLQSAPFLLPLPPPASSPLQGCVLPPLGSPFYQKEMEPSVSPSRHRVRLCTGVSLEEPMTRVSMALLRGLHCLSGAFSYHINMSTEFKSSLQWFDFIE